MTDSAKYLIHAAIAADGIVERSDVVGAVYGQTEGLLGEELDLRRLQESSKLGRIDVQIETSGGQSVGEITIAASLDRVETATLAAALETIDRVGPCRATVEVTELEDVRAAKRRRVIDRAERLLLEEFEETTSDAIIDEVRRRVATADVTTYEGLPAGPRVAEGDAIVVVEGRADVQAVLAAGVKNAIAVEGTDVPEAVAELTAERTTTAFLDGDRGGELILRELCQVGDVDQVAFAPTGRSVEDLSRSEILGSLRGTVAVDSIDDAATARDLVDAARDRAAGGVDASDVGGTDSDAGSADAGVDDADPANADPAEAPSAEARPDREKLDAAPTEPETAEAPVADVNRADATPAASAAPDADSDVGSAGEEVVADGAAAAPGDPATGATDVDGEATSDGAAAVEQPSTPADGAAVEVAEATDETHTDGGTETAAPAASVDPAGDGPAADATATQSDVVDGPRTIHEHVEAVRGTDRARLLDDESAPIETVPAEDVFETLRSATEVPAVIVLDAELEQRLLDLAAQRGVREVVAAELGSFTKRPTDVRVRTIEQLQVE